jgi:polysaccharide biosynthesis transport protein
MDLSLLMKLARRRALLLVSATTVAAVVGLVVAQVQPARFEAEVQLLVGPTSGDFQTLRAASNLAETYAELAVGTKVLEEAAANADHSIEPERFRESVRARANDLTRILTLSVTNPDPRSAAALANSLGSELVELASDATPEITESGEPSTAGDLRIVEPAQIPEAAETLGAGVVVPLAALAGLAAAFLAILSVESLGDRVREPTEAEELTGVTCIPIDVGVRRTRFGRRKAVSASPDPYRLVAAALDARDRPALARSISITPASDGGSGADLAIRLAGSLSGSGSRVVVIDSDPDRALAKRFGLGETPDIADYLATAEHTTILLNALHSPDQTGVLILAAGTPGKSPTNADEPLKFLQWIHNEVDRVILFTGSPGAYGDSLAWARSTDAVLLVATADGTRRSQLLDAARNLKLAGVSLTATILRR